MRGLLGAKWLGLTLTTTMLGTGCNREDADRLARVGRLLERQGETLMAGTHGSVATGLQAVRGSLDLNAVDARVATRLSWDKTLAALVIHVQAKDGEIHLTGTVHDPAQKQRAVAVAQATLGVEKVVDGLEIEPAEK